MSERHEDPFVTCPFNPVHRVPRSRIQGHIVKCQKKYPDYKTCPYNATHRFPEHAIRSHVQNCPSQAQFLPDDPPKVTGHITKPKPIMQEQYLKKGDPDYEDWDERDD